MNRMSRMWARQALTEREYFAVRVAGLCSAMLAASIWLPGVAEAACCKYDRADCTVGTHPDAHCREGRKITDGDLDDVFQCFTSGLIFLNPTDPFEYLAAVAAGEVYCNGQGDRSCQPVDHSAEPELPDGIDNNCDGVWPNDERCDGIDSDGDGHVDEGTGACLERHLFVPVCWTGGDQADFNGVVDRAERFFQEHTLLNQCGVDRDPAFPPKILYNAAPIGTVTCPASAAFSTDIDPSALLPEVKTHFNLQDWDYVTFVTRLPSDPQCIAGFTPGGGLINIRSDGRATPFPGEHVTFSHEWGHNIVDGAGMNRLVEEYLQVTGPNTVRASLGCDPTTCCVGAHCNPSANGHLCLGNESKNVTGWTWGAAPPPTWGDGSRCIMSNASAPGALTGDVVTGANSHRGWCQACLDHLNQFGPKCTGTFTGPRRRLELAGTISLTGLLSLSHYDLGDGRMGPALSHDGNVVIEVRDNAGALISTFAPAFVSHGPEIQSGSIAFLTRVPVAPSVSGPIKLVSVMQGTPVSQVTPFGRPAVAVAAPVTVECTTAASTPVQLSGSASYDPDGDTLRYKWTSSIALTNDTAPIASGNFPLGTRQATLTVTDGTPSSNATTIDVTVRDTTPPVLQVAPVSVTTCTPSALSVTLPKPSVLNDCQGAASVTFQASLISVNGKPLATPIAVDPNTPVVTLLPGTAVVRWTGRDPSSNGSSIDQTVTITTNEESAACCKPGQTQVTGTSLPNLIIRFGSQPYCIFGLGGGDTLDTDSGADYLSGGAGNDFISSAGSNNVITGGPGNDHIDLDLLSSGNIYGGEGNDVIHDTSGGLIVGGPGDDFIETDLVAHQIIPGPGRDAVYGGIGGDTVIIYNECELAAFETLNGGLGNDTLITPLSVAQLFQRGVTVSGFENVIIDSSNKHLSECW